MNCSDCRYSHPIIWDDTPILECHRNPPALTTIDNTPASGWPSVEEHDWCGEWNVVPEPTPPAQGPGDDT